MTASRISAADVAVGTELPEQVFRVTRADLVRYAGASGDFNPIHWNERVATEVGLPDVIAHGMFTMALAGRVVTDWTGDPGALVEYNVRFGRPVVVPDDDRGAEVTVARQGRRGPRRRPAPRRPHRHQRRREGALPGPRDRPPGMTAAAADHAGRCRSAPPPRLHVLRGHGDRAGPAVRAGEPAPEPVGAAACPAERAEPDPDRPVVALDFRLEDDRTTVTGTETVEFTPDLPVRELVFRLVPNGPDSAPAGNRLVVDAVRGDDVAGGRYEDAGAADPGGLYVVELDGRAGGRGVDRGGAGLHPVAGHGRRSTGSGPTTASPGGPAARRCWRGSRASAGPRTPSSTCPARPRPARPPTPPSPCPRRRPSPS